MMLLDAGAQPDLIGLPPTWAGCGYPKKPKSGMLSLASLLRSQNGFGVLRQRMDNVTAIPGDVMVGDRRTDVLQA